MNGTEQVTRNPEEAPDIRGDSYLVATPGHLKVYLLATGHPEVYPQATGKGVSLWYQRASMAGKRRGRGRALSSGVH